MNLSAAELKELFEDLMNLSSTDNPLRTLFRGFISMIKAM